MNKDDLTLAASTVDPLVEEQFYVFQLDTTELFNSPILLTYKYSQEGGVIRMEAQYQLAAGAGLLLAGKPRQPFTPAGVYLGTIVRLFI
ncbi:MAG: hypothetical protein IPN76_30940 [Saprospiraceae bacterium]|nr:hypothetical protein [Saprospiraceae bacterium]